LPTPDELVLLCYARQRVGRCVTGLDDGLYWSSQIDTFDPIFGVAVDFNTQGFDCTRYVDGRTAAKLVRCVR
jgi:hypothetical protein